MPVLLPHNSICSFPAALKVSHADILNVVSRNLDGADENEEQSDADLSGMEINAQIPGKKFSGINILSQGERVLVAVSLLFSIFLVKKTPFCVIDEVDAPLDYANNARYNKLIEEISNYSQIILITHNKKTMEIGKNIFDSSSIRCFLLCSLPAVSIRRRL